MKNRWNRSMMMTLIVCLMLLGTFVVQSKATAPAHAAAKHAMASCYGSSCNSTADDPKDPNTYGCWNSSAYYFQYSNSYGWERLWYSPTCNANWVQGASYGSNPIAGYTLESCPNGCGQGDPGFIFYCEDNGQNSGPDCKASVYYYTTRISDINYKWSWYTNMVDGTNKVEAVMFFQNPSAPINSGWH